MSDIKNEIQKNLEKNLLEYEDIADSDELIAILDVSEDLANAKINEEKLQAVCNKIFQKKYQDILLGKDDNTGGISRRYAHIRLGRKIRHLKLCSPARRVLLAYYKFSPGVPSVCGCRRRPLVLAIWYPRFVNIAVCNIM